MAFTATDLTNVEEAIINLATGQRVGSVRIGEHTIEYANTSLDKLERLRSIIQADLGAGKIPKFNIGIPKRL